MLSGILKPTSGDLQQSAAKDNLWDYQIIDLEFFNRAAWNAFL